MLCFQLISMSYSKISCLSPNNMGRWLSGQKQRTVTPSTLSTQVRILSSPPFQHSIRFYKVQKALANKGFLCYLLFKDVL